MSDSPSCDKCKREITTGIQAGLCPFGSECELWDRDLTDSESRFLYGIWEQFAKDHIDQLERDNAKLRAEVEQMRQDVLEEAAKVCEGQFEDSGWHPYFRSAAHNCAQEIRALKAMQPVSSENDTVQKR